MRPNLYVIGLDDFLSQYMPGGDMPDTLSTNIPAIDKKVLMGAQEHPICEKVVRFNRFSCLDYIYS